MASLDSPAAEPPSLDAPDAEPPRRADRARLAWWARAWAGWRGYWLVPGGEFAVAALRIAIALSMLWTLWRFYPVVNQQISSSYYRVGLWMLYPGRPGAGLLSALQLIAWVSSATMLLGAWSRLSHLVSLVTMLLLTGYLVSDTPSWSHPDVPQMLASLAFLGAHGGAVLSVDAWWRRRRGRPLRTGIPHQASLRLVQIAVVGVFFVAGYLKLRSGRGLAWALSDNLRNQLLTRFDAIDLPRTPVASWLVDTPWRYELCALANLVNQVGMVAAVFLLRWPRLRAAIAIAYCAEVIGLGVVMNLWNPHWLPLAAVFIDWDAIARWRARASAPALSPPGSPPGSPPLGARGRVAFATAYVVVFALHAFWLNQRTRAFPFCSFPLFDDVRAVPGFERHHTYHLIAGRIEPLSDQPLPDLARYLGAISTYRRMWRDRSPEQVARDLRVVLDDVHAQWPDAHVTGVRLWLSVFEAPPYPAPAHLERFDIAVIGELTATGTMRTALGTLSYDGTALRSPATGIDLTGASLAIVVDDVPGTRPIAAAPTTGGWTLAAPMFDDPAYVIATPPGGGPPWLVAGRTARGY